MPRRREPVFKRNNMSEFYDQIVEELREHVRWDFPEHKFLESNVTITDGSEQTYQARYDVADDKMVFAEAEGDGGWYVETAIDEYSESQYSEMFKSHFSGSFEEFKTLYGDDWKKVALECAFENREL